MRKKVHFLAIVLFLVGLIHYQTNAQDLVVADWKSTTINQEDDMPLDKVLTALEKIHKVSFNYNKSLIQGKSVKNSLIHQNETLDSSLKKLLNPLNLSYERMDEGYYVIYSKKEGKIIKKVEKKHNSENSELEQSNNSLLKLLKHTDHSSLNQLLEIQDRIVRGVITSSEDSEPLPGVNIVIKGTSRGSVTNLDGEYTIDVPGPEAVIVFSSVGFLSREVVVGNQSTINLAMEPDIQQLQELVVVGYGLQKKTNLTGSITTINAKGLAEVPTPTLTQSIMGRSPGVFIKNVNGQPGDLSGVQINIRGFGSPLIIIDGLPATETEFNQLDPNDIQDFSILKDAAAAAVYGARAGNGVILIKTKRGEESEAKVTYTGNQSWQFFTIYPDWVGSYEYAAMENVARMNEGLEPVWTQSQLQKFKDGTDPAYPNTDWWNETVRKYAPQSQHNINVTGGNDKVKYFISGGYFYQEAQLKSNDTRNKRYNLRSNLDIAVSEKFDIGLNLSLIDEDFLGPLTQMERTREFSGIMGKIFRSRPYFPAQYPDPTKLPTMGGGDTAPTVYAEMDNVGYRKRNNSLGNATISFTYRLPFGIEAKAILDYDRYYQRYKEKQARVATYSYNFDTDEYTFARWTNDPSQLLERMDIDNNLNQQYFLTWNKSFKNHNLSALAVYEQLSGNSNWISASRMRYDFDIDYLFAGPDLDKDNNGSASESGRKGIITRLSYDYVGKYLFEFSSRYDGSPQFPKEGRWGFFPSVSLGWNISEEDFFKSALPFVSNLKLRGSYGKLGYDETGRFQYLATYALRSTYIFDGTSNLLEKGIRTNAIPNPNITWEKMTTYNTGVDINLWQSKLVGSFDYFYRLRTDVLGSRIRSIPDIVGANLPQENYAEYDNRGWEAVMTYNQQVGQYDVSLGGNISWNREKYVKIDQQEFATDEARRVGNRVGEWTDRFWGLMTDGLFTSKEEIENWADQDGKNNATILPGDIRYVDYNGDGRITNEDRVIIGRGVSPRFMYGINASVTWKGFDFNMLWQGAGLYDFNLRSAPDLRLPFYAGNTPLQDWYESSWTPENEWMPSNTTSAKWPRYRTDGFNRNHANFNRDSDFWLINGAYIRLKTVQLGYTIPSAISSKIGISTCRFYVSGYNLLTFSAVDFIDPEADTSPARVFGDYYPPVGTYNTGVLLQF